MRLRKYEPTFNPITGTMTARPVWEDHGPSFARTQGYHGSLVVGASEGERTKAEAAKARDAKRHAA